jgi:arylsulfatase A-like enzyme
MRLLICAVGLSLLLGSASVAQSPGNVLLLIADDLSLDLVGAYSGASGQASDTPEIDALAKSGVRFLYAYSQSSCSPTRAAILTGQYGFRNGVGNIDEGANRLAHAEMRTLPRALPLNYRSAAFGKWHLDGTRYGAIDLDEHGDVTHPVSYAGFEYFEGKGGNFNLNKEEWDDGNPHKNPLIPPNDRTLRAGTGENYYRWEKRTISRNAKVRDEWVECTHRPMAHCYITTHTVDDAIRKMRSFRSDPWFVWIGFNAIHGPTISQPRAGDFNAPPDELLDGREYDATTRLGSQRAHLRALDHEIGRLVDSVDLSNTTIIFVGDNGPGRQHTERPQCKGTFRECGIRVPLIIRRPGGVAGKVVETPVNVTDLFDTIAGVAADDPDWDGAPDSESLLPYLDDPAFDEPLMRSSAGGASVTYADRFNRLRVRERRSIQDGRYKYIWSNDGAGNVEDGLYDLQRDPDLEWNLLDAALPEGAASALGTLRRAMAELQDADDDGPDFPDPGFDYRSDYRFDNCVDVPNAVREHCGGDPDAAIPCSCDTDRDGIGNMCDCDFDNDGDCDERDFDGLLVNSGLYVADGADPDADMNCDGLVGELDLLRWNASEGEPGPSGLWCADARREAADPPCTAPTS